MKPSPDKPLPDIPAPVRKEAERIAAEDNESGQIARLLVTDPRMVAVWDHLKKREPRPDWWTGQGETPPADKTEAAMVLILHSCCDSVSTIIDTVAELHEARDSFKAQAKRLRREANRLHRRDSFYPVGYRSHICEATRTDGGTEPQVAALIRVAEWCEAEAARLHKGAIARNGRVIQRASKHWRDKMGIATYVAGAMTLFYGSPLYGRTATIVNVITERLPDKDGGGIVTKEHVRDWLKAIGSEKDSPE